MKMFMEATEKLTEDYRFFIEYIRNNEIKLSAGTGNIGKKDCFALNHHMQTLKECYTKEGRTQDFYTAIDFFYFFSIRGGICQIVKKKGRGLTMCVTERYQVFEKMAAFEQYILMMIVWLGEYMYAMNESNRYFRTSMLFEQFRNTKVGQAVAGSYPPGDRGIWGYFYSPDIRLMTMFGLLRLEWIGENEEDAKNKFRVKAIYMTETGNCLRELFTDSYEFWFIPDMEKSLSAISKIIREVNAQMKKKLLSFWYTEVKSEPDTIELKVELGSCIRTIKIGSQYTLDDLSFLILKSVKFDEDHLYYFRTGYGNTKKTYYSPECQETFDTLIPLAELQLYEGMQLEYLYDFGDNWEFKITVSRITPGLLEECLIKKVKGENPEQYGEAW